MFISVLISACECVPLIICYHLYFLRVSKVWSMLHHGSVGRVQSKECYYVFMYFFGCFLLFFIKNLFLLFSFLFFLSFFLFAFLFSFFSFFWCWSIKFPQQNLNQLEIRIGDKLYVITCYENMRWQFFRLRGHSTNLHKNLSKVIWLCFIIRTCVYVWV